MPTFDEDGAAEAGRQQRFVSAQATAVRGAVGPMGPDSPFVLHSPPLDARTVHGLTGGIAETSAAISWSVYETHHESIMAHDNHNSGRGTRKP